MAQVPTNNILPPSPIEKMDPKHLLMAAGEMYFERPQPIRDQMEGSVLEESIGKENADAIKNIDKLMKGEEKEPGWLKARPGWIERIKQEQNKKDYPTPNQPMKVDIG